MEVDQGARQRILQAAGLLARQVGESADREHIVTDDDDRRACLPMRIRIASASRAPKAQASRRDTCSPADAAPDLKDAQSAGSQPKCWSWPNSMPAIARRVFAWLPRSPDSQVETVFRDAIGTMNGLNGTDARAACWRAGNAGSVP